MAMAMADRNLPLLRAWFSSGNFRRPFIRNEMRNALPLISSFLPLPLPLPLPSPPLLTALRSTIWHHLW